MTPKSTKNLPAISDEFIRHIANGEEAEALVMINQRVRKDLPWSTITDVWTDVLTDIGELQEITDQVVVPIKGARDHEPVKSKLFSKITGTSVVVSTLRHEAGELMSRVAIDRNGLVIGILILPLGTVEYPF